jgi:hypothetical protein
MNESPIRFLRNHFVCCIAMAERKEGDKELLAELEMFWSLPGNFLLSLNLSQLGVFVLQWAKVRK